MKFDDEELSRILEAHDRGTLKVAGHVTVPRFCELGPRPDGCLLMTARNKASVGDDYSVDEFDVAKDFDNYYQHTWSVDELLAALELRGLA